MKRILSIFLLFSFTLSAQVPDEVHEKCKDVADYVGCVQIFTGSVITKKETAITEVKELKKALGLLPSRLQNTSLRDFSMAIQPFTDALASAQLAHSDEKYSVEEKIEILTISNASMRLERAIQLFRDVWSMGIEIDANAYPSVVGSKYVSCSRYDFYIDAFNQWFESNVLSFHAVNMRIIDFSFLDSTVLENQCYMNSLDYDPWPTTKGIPIYRQYEGSMLFWIIQAANEIIKTGDFIIFPEPYKNLEDVLVETYKNYEENEIQILKDDIEKWKEIHEAESNPWIATNDIYLKDKRSTQIFKGVAFGLRDFSKPKDIEKSIEGLKYLYASDFTNFDERFCNRRNYICHREKVENLITHSVALAKNITSSAYGSKKENILYARELLVAALSHGFESCENCFNEKGIATHHVLSLILQRKYAYEVFEELDVAVKNSNFEDFPEYEGLTLKGHRILKALD
tara:strand:- start:68 stop:1441 length:1374 start_codon:yes stop_codon:yes gene_type:complete